MDYDGGGLESAPKEPIISVLVAPLNFKQFFPCLSIFVNTSIEQRAVSFCLEVFLNFFRFVFVFFKYFLMFF